jgi:hypothetical protein
MAEDELLSLVKGIFKSRKVNGLKVTAHKELIRLLAAQSTKENLELIIEEFNHK